MVSNQIQTNDYVLLKLPSGNTKLMQLRSNDVINLGKFGKFRSSDLIGKQFTIPYEITHDNCIRPLEKLDYLEEFELGADEDASNQTIVDNPNSQKLTHAEIEDMKKDQSVASSCIIQKIAENNASFDRKTEFSKAKYIKRKRNKFAKMFYPIKPTMHSMCDYYFSKNPERTKEIRVDTLSQAMSLANVQAGSKFIVVDDIGGLLVASMLERMSSYGQILALHDKQSPNHEILRMMNYEKEVTQTVHYLPWVKLDEPEESPKVLDDMNDQAKARAASRENRKMKTRQLLQSREFDGLIIASHFDPKEILIKLNDYIALSKNVVVYSTLKESLLDSYEHLRSSEHYINVQLTESWLREYQVPVFNAGSHPEMMTSGSGGYLLSAIKVDGQKLDVVPRLTNYSSKKKRFR